MDFSVVETFLSLSVIDMNRAAAFYAKSLGAVTKWSSPHWSSLEIAGVRLGLFASAEHSGGRVGLHFAVTDLDKACAAIEGAGGRVVAYGLQVAPGVLVAEVSDTEGNIFSLQRGAA